MRLDRSGRGSGVCSRLRYQERRQRPFPERMGQGYLPPWTNVDRTGARLMSLTYRNFEWLAEDYPWVENGLFVVYVKGTAPETVVDALTVEDLGTATGLAGLNERHWDHFSAIGAAQVGQWTVAIAPGTYITDPELQEVSQSAQVFVHSVSVNADCRVAAWEHGSALVAFDPLLRTGFTPEEIPPAWKNRLSEVGIDPEREGPMDDGLFHIQEASFALAANYTGCVIDSDALSSAAFFVGRGRM